MTFETSPPEEQDDPATPDTEEQASHQLDAMQLQQALAALEREENFAAATMTGSGAAVTCAAIWAAVTAATEYQIGWMAVGVGVLVALTVRYFGKGVTTRFQVLGGGLSLLGCLLGNFFTLCYFGAKAAEVPVLEFMTQIDFAAVPGVMMDTASPMDALFYGIAIYEGYRLSLRAITEDDLRRAADPFAGPVAT